MSCNLQEIFNTDISNEHRLTIKLNENFQSLSSCIGSGSTSNGAFLPLSGGTVTGNTRFSLELSASTLYSGSTNLEDIIKSLANPFTGSTLLTSVQPGINTFTGGTQTEPTVNITGASLDNLYVSGDNTANSFSATTLSGQTIFSGSVDLYQIAIFTGDTLHGGTF